MDIPAETLSKFSTKESSKEKYNKTNGQIDNLKGYTKPIRNTSRQSDDLTTADKQIKREANFIKNIHIDDAYQKLKSVGLITDDKYQAWWCGTMHTLGVSYVHAQAEIALSKGTNPQALFHFLINKAINKSTDAHMPRFN